MKKKTNNQTITIKTNDENPEPLEVIADAIIQVSDAFDKINKSRLNKRAIVLLVKDACSGRISINDINLVLDIVPKLKDYYIKK